MHPWDFNNFGCLLALSHLFLHVLCSHLGSQQFWVSSNIVPSGFFMSSVPTFALVLCTHWSSDPTVLLYQLVFCTHCSFGPLYLLVLCTHCSYGPLFQLSLWSSAPTGPPFPLFLWYSVPTGPLFLPFL